MNQTNLIKKGHSAIFCIYFIAMSQMQISSSGRSILLGSLALAYSFLSLPFYFIKQKIVSALVFVHSLVFVLLSALSLTGQQFQSWLVDYRLFLLLIVIMLAISQFFIYTLVRDEDEKIFEKTVEGSSEFESRMETKPMIKWLSFASFILSILPIIIYDGPFRHLLSLILLVKLIIDGMVRYDLIKVYQPNQSLSLYLRKLILLDVGVNLLLAYVLFVGQAPFLFSLLLLFSRFTIPLMKQKEYEQSNQ